MKRCLLLLTVILTLVSCAHERVRTGPYSELKQQCDNGSDAACHDYAFFTFDAIQRKQSRRIDDCAKNNWRAPAATWRTGWQSAPFLISSRRACFLSEDAS